jgi:tyrosyl-tRNA synthetase
MTTDEKIKLITRNLEETLTEEELKTLIESGTPLRHYIGIEISGKVHLGTGLANLLKVKDLHDAGVETTIFLADWHTWINNKLDGTLETAQKMAREYFEEAMKAAYICIGGDPDTLIFEQGTELYKDSDYWATVIKIAKNTTISRMMRSTTIMGRQAGDSSDTATLFYPAMQAADIYTMGINITHAGSDQRNVHVVARDVAKDLGLQKPVAIHHHLLQGLLKPEVWPIPKENREELATSLKMSKSKPDSAVFITDSPEEIKRKVGNAFCPEGEVEFNPILDWTKYLIFYQEESTLTINRKEEHGGDVTYSSYGDLEKDFTDKKLHPMDLKAAVADWLINILAPAREYFEDPRRREALEEITNLTSKK